MSTPPLTIWLQFMDDALGATWTETKVYPEDTEYVHAESVSKALAGHRRSQLFGDNGLLAATMRCVNALAEIEMLIDQSECHNNETVAKILKIIRPTQTPQ